LEAEAEAEAAAGAISSPPPPPPAGLLLLLLLFLLLKYLLMSTSMVASWMEQPSCGLQLGELLMMPGRTATGGVAGRGLPCPLARSPALVAASLLGDGLGAVAAADQRWFSSCRRTEGSFVRLSPFSFS
jgi:hypothetical protein